MSSVSKIQAKDIHARDNKVAEHFSRFAGRSNGRDDSRLDEFLTTRCSIRTEDGHGKLSGLLEYAPDRLKETGSKMNGNKPLLLTGSW